jgi:hypothetical protein
MRTICVIVNAVQWTPERNGIRLNAGSMGAVRGVRRVAALSADGGEGDVIRDALVRELRVVLELEGLSIVTVEESQPTDTPKRCPRRPTISGRGSVVIGS